MKRVETMPDRKGGKPGIHPWDELLDGTVWMLVPGEDFFCPPASFRKQVYVTAKARGGRAVTRIEEDGFYLQFVPGGEGGR